MAVSAQYFTGHPAAAQAYAWSSPMEGSKYWWFFAVFASAINQIIIIFLFASGPSKIAIALSLSGVLVMTLHYFSVGWAGRVLIIVKALSEAVRIKSLGRSPLCFGAYGVQPFTDSRVVQ